jgi:hypothetical protein
LSVHPRPPQATSSEIPRAAWRTERSFMKLLRWFTGGSTN